MTESTPPIVGGPNRFMDVLPRLNDDEEYEPTPIPFTVLYRVGMAERAMYEPTDGTYLGMWLRDGLEKRPFESSINRKHAVYVNEMRLGEEVPIMWLLQSIAALATPLFIVHPPEVLGRITGTDVDVPVENKIIYLAQRLGAFNLPMFVAFYPSNHGLSATEYTLLFRYARSMFMAYAPMVSFVWVAPSYQSTSNSPFFPGNDAVDWVAVQLMAEHDVENSSGFSIDIIERLEPFYMAFQARHPIMLLPVGVSHWSQNDFVFRINEAGNEITRVYDTIRVAFPRVRMIVYGDGFGIGLKDDFSITSDPELRAIYRQAINHEHFVSNLVQDATTSPRWVRSVFNGYYFDGKVYVDVQTIERELFINTPSNIFEINERSFVEISHIEERAIHIDPVHEVIFINLLN